jgi:hypothetical protein
MSLSRAKNADKYVKWVPRGAVGTDGTHRRGIDVGGEN